MKNVATSVQLGQSKAHVIENPLNGMDERMFWDDVSVAFARTAADPVESAREKAEFDSWDRSTSRDFQGEEW